MAYNNNNYGNRNYNNNGGKYNGGGGKKNSPPAQFSTNSIFLGNPEQGKFLQIRFWSKTMGIDIGTCQPNVPITSEVIANSMKFGHVFAFQTLCELVDICEDVLVQEVFTLLDITLPPSHPVEDALNMDVLQVIAFFTAEEEERIMRDVLKGCDANRWHPYFADCVAKGTNKATGIDAICSHYGIDMKDTVAFGDGGNDITMLRHAGVGVAMGNASDEVKEHADMITDTVDNDGIAKALKSLMQI